MHAFADTAGAVYGRHSWVVACFSTPLSTLMKTKLLFAETHYPKNGRKFALLISSLEPPPDKFA
jgi:hypothetical protein